MLSLKLRIVGILYYCRKTIENLVRAFIALLWGRKEQYCTWKILSLFEQCFKLIFMHFFTFWLSHLESFNSAVCTRKVTLYIVKQSQTPNKALDIVLAIFQKIQTFTEEIHCLNVSCLPNDK